MTTTASAYERREVERFSSKWWVLLILGIGWILVSIVVLGSGLDSAATIGYLVGGYLIAIGVMEFVMIGLAEGWKWLHGVLGVLFVVGGFAAFSEPFQTFRVLALLLGFFLVLKGSFEIVAAFLTRHESDLWWMLLIGGILEVLLGVWAAGYPGRSAHLLILWVGIGALIRGITQIVLAFQVRSIHEEVT